MSSLFVYSPFRKNITKKYIHKFVIHIPTVVVLLVFFVLLLQPHRFKVLAQESYQDEEYVQNVYESMIESSVQNSEGEIQFETLLVGEGGETEITYVVSPGDTLSKIAKMFGTTIGAIKNANNISDANTLRVGDRLTIAYDKSIIHEIREDITVKEFAKKYQIQEEDLLTLNYLTDGNDILQAGQQVFVPLNKVEAEERGLIQKKQFVMLDLPHKEENVFEGNGQVRAGTLSGKKEISLGGDSGDPEKTGPIQQKLVFVADKNYNQKVVSANDTKQYLESLSNDANNTGQNKGLGGGVGSAVILGGQEKGDGDFGANDVGKSSVLPQKQEGDTQNDGARSQENDDRLNGGGQVGEEENRENKKSVGGGEANAVANLAKSGNDIGGDMSKGSVGGDTQEKIISEGDKGGEADQYFSCKPDQCFYEGQCWTKPENAVCAPEDDNNAWICKSGFVDTGRLCISVQEYQSKVSQSSAPKRSNKVLKQWYFNPYNYGYSNGRGGGHCTHYAGYYRKANLGKDINRRGNAKYWYDNARAMGRRVGSTPEVNAIVVMKYGSQGRNGYGHVGIVLDIDRKTRQILVEDMNYVGRYIVSQHWVDLDSTKNPIIGFVYPN